MTLLAVHRELNQPIVEEHDTFVHLIGVGRFMVAVAIIHDDGESEPGPTNYEAICPNFQTAHAFVEKMFNNENVTAKRLYPDAIQSSYTLHFDGEKDSQMVVFLELMRLVDSV